MEHNSPSQGFYTLFWETGIPRSSRSTNNATTELRDFLFGKVSANMIELCSASRKHYTYTAEQLNQVYQQKQQRLHIRKKRRLIQSRVQLWVELRENFNDTFRCPKRYLAVLRYLPVVFC
jgi:hypothetical protein